MQSLTRKLALRASSAATASALSASTALARTGQVARTTLEIADGDVFLDEALSSAADTSETVGEHEGELEGSREVTDDMVDVLPDMTDDTWEAEDVGQIAADGADWAAEFAGELEVELEAAKVELEQSLEEAHQALTEAGLARSEAAQAVADAAEAAATATQAIQDALAAAELAEGAAPSWNTVDPVAADAAGKPAGAIWYVRNTAGRVIRMWELTALGWIARPFDETVIPQVAIGSGTYGTLAGDRIVAKSITAAQIKALAITAAELATNSVTAVKIAADAVTAEKILAGAITTDKLNALAVTADKIAAGAIIAQKIAAGAITAEKIAATAIDGMTITGALIRTAPTGQRMQLDVSGLRAFNTQGVEVGRFASGDDGITFTASSPVGAPTKMLFGKDAFLNNLPGLMLSTTRAGGAVSRAGLYTADYGGDTLVSRLILAASPPTGSSMRGAELRLEAKPSPAGTPGIQANATTYFDISTPAFSVNGNRQGLIQEGVISNKSVFDVRGLTGARRYEVTLILLGSAAAGDLSAQLSYGTSVNADAKYDRVTLVGAATTAAAGFVMDETAWIGLVGGQRLEKTIRLTFMNLNAAENTWVDVVTNSWNAAANPQIANLGLRHKVAQEFDGVRFTVPTGVPVTGRYEVRAL